MGIPYDIEAIREEAREQGEENALLDFLRSEPRTYFLSKRHRGEEKWGKLPEVFECVRDAIHYLQQLEADNENFSEGIEYQMGALIEVDFLLPQKLHRPWDENASRYRPSKPLPRPFEISEVRDLFEPAHTNTL